MSHAVKLAVFFIVSVALHGAGLWAAAGRYEARVPDVPAGVAIVDRGLFFRHAERTESQASSPVSATERIAPQGASTLRPSQPGESMARAPVAAAADAEPERRAPAGPVPGAMARLDLSTVAPAPPPRREARAPDNIDAARREPERQAPASPSAAIIAPAQPERRAPASPAPAAVARLDLSAVEPAPPPRREALAPDGIDAARRQPERQVPASSSAAAVAPAEPERRAPASPAPAAVARLDLSAVEPAPPPRREALAPDAIEPERRAPTRVSGIDAMAPLAATRPQAQRSVPAPVPARTSEALAPTGTARQASLVIAPPLRSAGPARQAARAPEPERVAPPAPRPAPPDVAARGEIAPAEAAVAPAAVPARAPRDRPALRGTLPAPLLAAAQPEAARPIDSPVPARRSSEGPRLRPSLPDDIAPHPAPVTTAAPRELAALAPEAPARRLGSSEPPSGRDDPADRFTRAYQGGECFFPLRLASRDGAAIRGYGLRAESVDMFAQAFTQALGREPNVDWRPLTDAQCGGISFTRLILGDSAPTVRIALERKELGLGHNLAGRVTGSRLEFVTLLVVDDSGVVHNVLDHLTPEGADLAFDIPVQPVDDGTDRVQLLMAVGASRPLPILESTAPVHSDDLFPALRDQAVDAGAYLELGLEDFVILGGGS